MNVVEHLEAFSAAGIWRVELSPQCSSESGSFVNRVVAESALDPSERFGLVAFCKRTGDAVVAARDGDVRLARYRLRESRNLRSLTWSDTCRLLSESFELAAEAYLDYRLNRFEEARSKLVRAIEVDAAIESRQLSILMMHRVQLVHNLMRIMIRCGQSEEAFNLGWDILAYLEGESKILPGAASWDTSMLQQIPPDLICDMFDQVAAEIASYDYLCNSGNSDCYSKLRMHGHCERNGSTLSAGVAHAWMALKLKSYENAIQFLSHLGDFVASLSFHNCSHRLFYWAVCLDVFCVASEMDVDRAQTLALDLSFSNMPSKLKSTLGNLVAAKCRPRDLAEQ